MVIVGEAGSRFVVGEGLEATVVALAQGSVEGQFEAAALGDGGGGLPGAGEVGRVGRVEALGSEALAAVARAWTRPVSLRGMSVWPWSRRSAFQAVSPWRTRQIPGCHCCVAVKSRGERSIARVLGSGASRRSPKGVFRGRDRIFVPKSFW